MQDTSKKIEKENRGFLVSNKMKRNEDCSITGFGGQKIFRFAKFSYVQE